MQELSVLSQGYVSRPYRWALLFLLLGSLHALLGHALLGQATGGSTRAVHGVVVDAETHAPIGRALVLSIDQRIAQLTDSEGRFAFELELAAGAGPSSEPLPGRQVPPDQIVLLARKPGYLQNSQPKVASLAEKAAGEVELKLTPEAVIKGRITVPGVDATAVRIDLLRRQIRDGLGHWELFQSRMTNSRGEYRFAELDAGQYKLMTNEWLEPSTLLISGRSMTGYPPAFYPEAADLAAVMPMHVRAGDRVQADITLRAQAYYPVRIPIANLARETFLIVTVGSEAQPSGFSLGFNPNTRLIEGSLPNGVYHLAASSFGEQQATGSIELTVAGGPAQTSPLTLIPNITLPVIVREQFTATHQQEHQQFQGGRSSGPPILQGEGSSPPMAINLQAEEGSGPVSALRAAKPGESSPVLENVRPGRFRVIATPFRGYVASLSAGGVDLLREPLVIGPGGASAPLEVTLRDDTATLAVTIRGPHPATSAFLAGYMVVCVPRDAVSARLLQGFAGQDGKITIEDVPPGRYLLLAFPAEEQARVQNLEFRNEEAMARYTSKGTAVTLAPGQQAQVEVPLLTEDAE